MSRSSAYMAPMFMGFMPGAGPFFNLGMTAKYLSDQSGLSDAASRGGRTMEGIVGKLSADTD